MSYAVLVVGEGVTDPRLVCELTDRLLREHIEWLRDLDISDHRTYVGLDDAHEYLKWTEVKTLHQKRFGSSGRRFGDRHGPEPDARATHKLFKLIKAAVSRGRQIDGVVIFRDTDKQPTRLQGITRERDRLAADAEATSWKTHIAIGVAKPKSEAWVLAGFDPRDKDEKAALNKAREKLGFQPNLKSERLMASDHDPASRRSAKKVMEHLCCDHERKRACWRDTSLDTLRERGRKNGLKAYCDEVQARIATLWT